MAKYLEWIKDRACKTAHQKQSYNKLFEKLFNTDFFYIVEMDKNRAEDGLTIRNNYILANGVVDFDKSKPCSVLEMMFALAKRCEDSIMHDSDWGDRTPKWFWVMIKNMGLHEMTDEKFDEKYVEEHIDILLERKYSPNGKGGLFRVSNHGDLREVEIWYQAMWYLNQFFEFETEV